LECPKKIQDHLPKLLIPESAKAADMVFISSQGLCGEDDFRLAPFGKRKIIGWEGRKPSGQKESICT